MATFQLKLRTRNIKTNYYPIVLRVIHNRKSKELVVLDIKVEEKYWDLKHQRLKSSFPRANYYNKQLVEIKSKVDSRIIELNDSNRNYSSEHILQALDPSYKSRENSKLDLSSYIYEFIELNPENIKLQTLKYYKSTANRWNEIYPELNIKLITEDHVLKFRKYLNDQGNAINTVYNRLKVLRKIFRYAVKKKHLSNDPMIDIKLQRKNGNREYLSLHEIVLINKYQPTSAIEELTKDVFLFECYTGLRISDICSLRKEEVIKEDNFYRIRKSLNKTDELHTLKLNKHAERIYLKYVEQNKGPLVFPLVKSHLLENSFELYKNVSSITASINKTLKSISNKVGITKNVSTHIGRHSFAVNSITMGADIYVLSKLLGHTSIKTTEIYAKVVDKKKDELIDLWDKV